MSPEQIRAERATVQSDIYAVGVLLYELIAGQPPLRGATTYEILRAHLEQVPQPLRELRSDIPQSLSDAIAKALEKDPARRFASAAAFHAALTVENAPTLSQTSTMVPNTGVQRITTDEMNRPTGSFSAPVQELVRHLASFIGPIAKVIVARLLKQTSDLEQLYTLAAKEIDTDADRQRFFRTRPH
jgi:eukaryotic-like serine/threonine-protein kinase